LRSTNHIRELTHISGKKIKGKFESDMSPKYEMKGKIENDMSAKFYTNLRPGLVGQSSI
jgi:hypothetical protein